MIDALNVIKGAVSSKDLVPVFTHVAVHDGRVHGFDGRLHISAPCPQLKGYSFTAPLLPFAAAVEACGGAPDIEVGEGRAFLTVSKDGFEATIPYGPIESFPIPELEKKRHKVKGLLPVLQALHPFVGIDATRAWSASIRFQGLIALATNNIVLLEALHSAFAASTPSMTLPLYAVEEMIHQGVDPQAVAVTDNTATFFYPDGVWLRTKLVDVPWPDAKAILRSTHDGANLKQIPTGLAEAVARVLPFCVDPKNPLIRFTGETNTVSTLDGPIRGAVGGLRGNPIGTGVYHAAPLVAVLGVCQRADWARFPRVPFEGTAGEVPVSGVLLGVPNV